MIRDVNENPHRERSFYEYPELYEFFQSRVVDRDAQVRVLERFEPDGTNRVLEFGCGAGPLLVRIEDEYEDVLGVDRNGADAPKPSGTGNGAEAGLRASTGTTCVDR